MKKLILITTFAVTAYEAVAQVSETEKAIAYTLVQHNGDIIGLSAKDQEQSIVNSTYIIPGSDVRMVYLQQSFKKIPVYNQLHVLAFKDNKVVSVAGSRIAALESKINNPSAIPAIDPVKAVRTAIDDVKAGIPELIVPLNITNEGRRFEFSNLGVSSEKVFAELLWFPVEGTDEVKLAWQVFLAPYNSSSYWLVRIDAMTNTVISKEDMTISCNWGPEEGHEHGHSVKGHFHPEKNKASQASSGKEKQNFVVNTATYRVVKYPAESPIHPGGSPSLHTDPWLMSPGNATTLGWHNDGSVHYDSTRGNNVFAYEDRDANNLPGYAGLSSTPQPALTFDFVPDFNLEPIVRTPAPNQQFNTTNLFYWNNLMHDLTYIYGFTETARNYQNNNMGRGGVGNDYVQAEAQDGSGTNNANFSSGVEGTRGRMQMYLWTAPTPDRDGDVDNGIIAHEYGHGVSNRMTGSGAGCLTVVEQMGEGWSDYLGLMITHDWASANPSQGFNNPRGIGTYALNQPITGPGIRQYRYTTNMAVNPLTYSNLPTVAVPHGVGTIWCTALWDMTWYIIQQAGINPNLFNPAAGGGNAIALKLVIEGLRLQPCNPGFISGRDAILKADTLFFGAQYSCAIWEAFARRGMGVGASQGSASVRGDETISFVNANPAITAQPQNASVCTGASHTFSVTATGLNLAYQWQVSTDGGTNYTNITGANASSYTLNSITAGMNNYRYRCIVSGCTPSVTSAAAILTVAVAPTINNSPADATVCEGANASFTVNASGSGLTYQWQLSTDGGNNYNNISGATSSTLNLSAVTVSMNNYRYRCQVTSAGCATSASTTAALLTVNALTVITAQPSGVTACAGSSTTLCVTATGSNLNYQWQSSPLCGGPWTNIAGATSNCLTIANPVNTTSYRCVVNGACGTGITSDCATITVINPVVITGQPADDEVCSGSNTSFTVTASSNQTINYQWQVSQDGGNSWSNISNGGFYSGAGTASLSITGAAVSLSNNRYRCQLTNIACSSPVNTISAILIVRQLPSVTLAAAPLTSLLPGQTTTLTATPAGSPGTTLTVTWFLNGSSISNAGNTRVVNAEQTGTYKVTIQETFGSGVTCSNQSADVVIGATPSPKLFIFPSPNDGRFTVSYYNNGGNSTQRRIVIIDAKGAKVYDRIFPIAGPYTLLNIDLRNAGRGIHFVMVGDASGSKLITGKVHIR